MRVSKNVLVPPATAMALERIKAAQSRWRAATEWLYATGGVWTIVFGLFAWIVIGSDDGWSALPWAASPGAAMMTFGGVIIWRRRKLSAVREALRQEALGFVIEDKSLNCRKAEIRKLVNDSLARATTTEQERVLLDAYNLAAEELRYQDINALDGGTPDLKRFEELVNALRVAADQVKEADERSSL